MALRFDGLLGSRMANVHLVSSSTCNRPPAVSQPFFFCVPVYASSIIGKLVTPNRRKSSFRYISNRNDVNSNELRKLYTVIACKVWFFCFEYSFRRCVDGGRKSVWRHRNIRQRRWHTAGRCGALRVVCFLQINVYF